MHYKLSTSVTLVNKKMYVFARLAALETPVREMFVTTEFYRVPVGHTDSCRKKETVKTYSCDTRIFRCVRGFHVLQLSSIGKGLLEVPRGLLSYVVAI